MDNNSSEQARLITATTIVATAAGIGVVNCTGGLFFIIKTIVIVSGLFGFLFLISSASFLKYYNPGKIGELEISKHFSRACFDTCLDTFGVNFPLILGYIILKTAGWNATDSYNLRFWIGLGITFVILLIISIFNFGGIKVRINNVPKT